MDQFDGGVNHGMLSTNIIMCLAGFTILFLHTNYESYLVTSMLKQQTSVPFNSMGTLADLVADGKAQMIDWGPSNAKLQAIMVGVIAFDNLS